MKKKLNITQESIREYVESERFRIDETMGNDMAFVQVSSQQILTQYMLDDDDVMRGITEGGGDGGYDAIYVFLNDVLINGEDPETIKVLSKSRVDIHFIQSKYQTHFSETIIQNWKDSFPNLINSENPDYERYNESVINTFVLIESLLKQTISKRLQVNISFWAVSLATEVHKNLEKQAAELKNRIESIIPSKNTSIGVFFVTASRLFELMEESPDEVMTLRATKEPLCPDNSSAILTVSLYEYYEFISDENGDMKKSLFEANIRDYQGNVQVNQAIRDTLNNKSSVDFWWLNNGITIVADSVTRDMDNSISLTNPRIVNGLQTSNEIAQYCKSVVDGEDERKVLIKCIAASDYETKGKIIQATNYQTTIPPAFLHSLETIHIQIERYFRNHGLHYDRRKSSGKNNGIPSKDIISISFLGQCLIATLLQQPDYSRARPAQILGDEKRYEAIFNEGMPLDSYLQLAKVSAQVRQLMRTSGLTRGEQNDLLFHVIYLCCARQSGSIILNQEDLRSLVSVDVGGFEDAVSLAKTTYYEFGGDSKAAKSVKLVDELKKKASANWGLLKNDI